MHAFTDIYKARRHMATHSDTPTPKRAKRGSDIVNALRVCRRLQERPVVTQADVQSFVRDGLGDSPESDVADSDGASDEQLLGFVSTL